MENNGDEQMFDAAAGASASSSRVPCPGATATAPSKSCPQKKLEENYNPNDIEVRLVDDSIVSSCALLKGPGGIANDMTPLLSGSWNIC